MHLFHGFILIVIISVLFAGLPARGGEIASAVPEQKEKPVSECAGDSTLVTHKQPIAELTIGAGLVMVAHVGICIVPHRNCFVEFEAASSYLLNELSLVAGYQHAIGKNLILRTGIGYVDGVAIGLSEAPNEYWQGLRIRTGLTGWWRVRPAFGWKCMVYGTAAENAWPIGAYAGLFAGI